MIEALNFFDRPNSYIGRSIPRPDAKRLLQGRGQYVDDLQLPRMVHAAFVRSPFAHARIGSIDTTAANAMPGVVAVFTGRDLTDVVTPYVGVLTHLQGLRSPPQMPLAVEKLCWVGEPLIMVLARSRALAEDACELINVDYEPLEATCDAERALDPDAPIIHAELGSNLCWERLVEAGDVDQAFAQPGVTVIERTFRFGRHTGVTLEPRAIIVEFNPAEDTMICHHNGQAPHMMQAIVAKHLDLAEENVRFITRDVGGSFGIKVHTYGDEIAVAAAAKILGRPVKFVADRNESFVSDIHARDHRVTGRIGVTGVGEIVGLEIDDLTGIGPYSMYPRTSAIECNQILNLTGAPYKLENYRARGRVVFQNKNMMCQYRAVGHPVAMAVADGLVEAAARTIGLDSVDLRMQNLIADDAYPIASATGMKFDDLSHHKAFQKLLDVMDYEGVKVAREKARKEGRYRGIGFVSMVEVTNPSPMFYGVGGAPISAQDGATIRLDAKGAIHVASSVTEQGQGANAVMGQIAADVFGVPLKRVKVTTGDTAVTPYGGGTWASRGTGIAGEAVLLAANDLKLQVLDVASVILQADSAQLDIVEGHVVNLDGTRRMSLADLGTMVYYRGNELPADTKPELIATRHFRVTDFPFVFTNGAMAAEVEVDIDTGFVTVLNFWAVEDCGRVINPRLVDEQVRGGVVQGIGAALYEECLYNDEGQLMNASMADYLVPMAAEMPDIIVAHVETPTKTSVLGAKGAGEAGTGGAPAAVMNAVNDALSPVGVSIETMPMTPERILKALGVV
ncbi:MAG: xanthine dehydrogenase family protein molybdopterin-binding subunit [Hyphomicrobiaceae bacterium]